MVDTFHHVIITNSSLLLLLLPRCLLLIVQRALLSNALWCIIIEGSWVISKHLRLLLIFLVELFNVFHPILVIFLVHLLLAIFRSILFRIICNYLNWVSALVLIEACVRCWTIDTHLIKVNFFSSSLILLLVLILLSHVILAISWIINFDCWVIFLSFILFISCLILRQAFKV